MDNYYHDDNFEFRGIRNIQDLFKSSIDEDYYKPTLVKSSYNSNYAQYESKGDKVLTVKEYLSLIEPYLADMINDYKSKGEWKIQLTAEINFNQRSIAYKSKHNLTREKQVILLMITDGEKLHYTAVKRLSGLLRGVAGNNNGDFYCLNCFHAYRTKNELEKHKKICENHDYCHVEMPNEDNKIIKYNQGKKLIRSPFIIYADLECLLKKISTCYNNLEKSSTTEINKYTTSGYSLFMHCSFDKSKNKLDYYRGDNCMEKFCKNLREHATKIINYEKKDMIPLTTK